MFANKRNSYNQLKMLKYTFARKLIIGVPKEAEDENKVCVVPNNI